MRKRSFDGVVHLATAGYLLLATFGFLRSASLGSERQDPQSLHPADAVFADGARGDCKRTPTSYLSTLESHPRDFALLRSIADCYFGLHPPAFAQAARYYARARQANPHSQEVDARLAQCDVALGRYREAAAILTKLAGLPNALPDIWKRAAEAYVAAHLIPQAESAYLAYLERMPADLKARSSLAHLYASEKAYDKALEQYRIALAANPNFVPALAGVARVMSWQRHLQQALELDERALRIAPENDEASAGRAFTLLWLGRADEARPLFALLHKRHPQDQEIAQGLKDSDAAIEKSVMAQARRTGNFSAAESYYRDRLSEHPEDARVLGILAKFNTGTRRCASGIQYARKAVELSNDPSFDLLLARLLADCQDNAEAIARYRRYLEFQPEAREALSELGHALLRDRRFDEAVEVFRRLLSLDSRSSDTTVALAYALGARGDYTEAIARYDEALKISPADYDALQGKAYVLYYAGRFAEARPIFQTLAGQHPDDPQNTAALASLGLAEEAAYWTALRPPSGASKSDLLAYYQKRLERYPKDQDALKAVADLQARLKNVTAAIQAYQRVLEVCPSDRNAKAELAQHLFWNREYEASIKLYRELSIETSDDENVLEHLAQAYAASGDTRNVRSALVLYQRLAARKPQTPRYRLEQARLELKLGDTPAARSTVGSLLLSDSANREAQLQLAQTDLRQGRLASSRREFERLLRHEPQNPAALLGRAQAAYYQSDLRAARQSAKGLIEVSPSNSDGLLLLVHIERARGRRRAARTLLDRVDEVLPGNPEVKALREKLAEQPAVTVHTSAAFAREIGPPTETVDVRGILHRGLPNEDLRSAAWTTTLKLSVLPKTESSIDLASLPASSPLGPFRDPQGKPIPTGITGETAPALFLVRQTTEVSRRLTTRLGGGTVRFGAGEPVPIAGAGDGNLVWSARSATLWNAGLTIALASGAEPARKFSVDFDLARSPITYTPLSVKLGVLEDRVTGRVNVFFNRRTQLHVEYYEARYSTARLRYETLRSRPLLAENERLYSRRSGGSVVFNRNLVQSKHLQLDAGYSGSAYGSQEPSPEVFLGFFNPPFYQSHLATTELRGKVWGPLGYHFSSGLGIERTQLDPNSPLKAFDIALRRYIRYIALERSTLDRALILSPTLTLKVGPHVSLSAGYTHYNSAQSLGSLRGNAVRLSADWTLW